MFLQLIWLRWSTTFEVNAPWLAFSPSITPTFDHGFAVAKLKAAAKKARPVFILRNECTDLIRLNNFNQIQELNDFDSFLSIDKLDLQSFCLKVMLAQI